ncbi:acetolactate decarboxylase [Pseudochryseolinea flava]|uniref:Alpha-acetolactate decarboxylase n=1 Tax=Pseudochryseolinea flava TaxID=2059302 RepID=A0A364XXH4_9BACT|nr:acetolactate decarboxylase [Pseudochryseolinea flava]RAV98698.1 hypothetical protein DQQ10_22030 [Pseudochryseolinea flava]
MKTFLTTLLIFIVFRTIGQPDEAIHYVSLNHAIHEGQFDGVSPVSWVKGLANFGLGSEEKLKSEVVVLDGKFYKIPASGKVEQLKSDDQLAFAALKQFVPDTTVRFDKPITLEELQNYLSKIIDVNAFSAIRVDATFDHAIFRSFEEQQKPYKPITDITETVFTKENIRGTIVGFFTPKSAEVLNSPAYHFHFIDEARETGGHLKAAVLRMMEIQIDYAQAATIHLPSRESIKHIDLNTTKK